MWTAISYVSSGLTLVAFLAAAGAWLYRRKMIQMERMIGSAPEADRAQLVANALEVFHIETKGLTKAHQYQLAMEQLRARQDRFRLIANVIIIVSILAVSVAITAIVVPGSRTAPPRDGAHNDSTAPANVKQTDNPGLVVGQNSASNELNEQSLILSSLPKGSKVVIEVSAESPEDGKIVKQKLEAVLRESGHAAIELIFPFGDHSEPAPTLEGSIKDSIRSGSVSDYYDKIETLGVTHILKVDLDLSNRELLLLNSEGATIGRREPLSKIIEPVIKNNNVSYTILDAMIDDGVLVITLLFSGNSTVNKIYFEPDRIVILKKNGEPDEPRDTPTAAFHGQEQNPDSARGYLSKADGTATAIIRWPTTLDDTEGLILDMPFSHPRPENSNKNKWQTLSLQLD